MVTTSHVLEAKIRADTNGFESALSSATSSISGFRTAVAGMGAGLAALGAGGLAVAVNEARKFEDAMVELQKVTNASVADNLSPQIRELANTIPLAQTELADLAAQAGRFGIRGEKNIMRFTEATAKMAFATDMNATEAGESFARLATLTQMPISEVENLGSTINALSNNFATSSSEIVDAALRSSGSLKQLGISNQHIYALNAAINQASESSERAGTRLRRLAQNMLSPSQRAFKYLLPALNMTKMEFINMGQEAPIKLMKRMGTIMKKGGERAVTLRQGLSSVSEQALSALMADWGEVERAMRLANKEWAKNNSLQKEFTAQMDTLTAQLQITKNRLRNIAIATGNVLLPAITELVKWINSGIGVIGKFNEKLGGVPLAAAGVSATIVGLSTAITALAPVISALAPAVGALASAFGLMLAPVVAVTAAVAAYQNNIAGVQTQTRRVANVFRDELTPTIKLFKSAFGPVLDSFRTATVNAFGNSGASGAARKFVRVLADKLIPVIRGTFGAVRGILRGFSKWWDANWTGVMSRYSLVLGVIATLTNNTFSMLTAILKGDTARMSELVRAFAWNLRELMYHGFDALAGIVHTGLKAVDATLATSFAIWSNMVKDWIYRGFTDQFKLGFTAVQSYVQTKLGIIGGVINTQMATWVPIVRSSLSILENIIFITFDAILEAMRGDFTDLQYLVNAGWQLMVSATRSGMTKIRTEVVNGLPTIRQKFGQLFNWLVTKSQTGWTRVKAIWGKATAPLNKHLNKIGLSVDSLAKTIFSLTVPFGAVALAIKSDFIPAMNSGKLTITGVLAPALAGNLKPLLVTIAGLFKTAIPTAIGSLSGTITGFIGTALVPLTSRFKFVRAAGHALKYAIGTELLGAFHRVKGGIVSLIKTVAGRFAPLILRAGGLVSGLASMFGGKLFGAISKIAGRIVPFIATTGRLGTVIGGLTNPIGWVVLALSGLWMAWKTNFMNIQQHTTTVLNALKALLRGDTTQMKNILAGGATAATTTWRTKIQKLITDARKVFNTVKTVVINALRWLNTNAFQPVLRSIMQLWRTHGKMLLSEAKQTFDAIKLYIKIAVGVMYKIWDMWGNEILAVTKFIFDAVGSVINTALDVIITAVGVAMDIIQLDFGGAFNKIKGLVTRILGGVMNFVRKWGSGLIGYIGRKLGQLVNWFARSLAQAANKVINGMNRIKNQFFNKIGQIVNRIGRFPGQLRRGFGNAIQSANNRFKAGLSASINIVRNKVKAILNVITNLKGRFKNAGKGLINAFKNGLQNKMDDAVRSVKNGVKKIRNLLPGSDAKEGPLSDLTDSGSALPETFAKGMDDQIDSVLAKAQQMADVADPTLRMSGKPRVPTAGLEKGTNVKNEGDTHIIVNAEFYGDAASDNAGEEIASELKSAGF